MSNQARRIRGPRRGYATLLLGSLLLAAIDGGIVLADVFQCALCANAVRPGCGPPQSPYCSNNQCGGTGGDPLVCGYLWNNYPVPNCFYERQRRGDRTAAPRAAEPARRAVTRTHMRPRPLGSLRPFDRRRGLDESRQGAAGAASDGGWGESAVGPSRRREIPRGWACNP